MSGCTAQGPYCGNTTDKRASVVAGPRYNLAFIEFGEQGSFQDVSQLQDAAELIKRTARPFVVTYIHGWHNNAVSNDVDRFRSFLSELSQSPSIQRSKYNVVGVYLGWRGEITTFPGITELTFWSRKAAAERLASNLDCYDAIATISAVPVLPKPRARFQSTVLTAVPIVANLFSLCALTMQWNRSSKKMGHTGLI